MDGLQALVLEPVARSVHHESGFLFATLHRCSGCYAEHSHLWKCLF